MLLLAAAEKDCGVTWEKRRLPEEWERQTEYKMNLRFTLLSLSVVLSAYSTDSTAAAAADGGPDDKTTCSIEWEKDHGLILHRRKLTLETVGELLIMLTQDNANNDNNWVSSSVDDILS